jgi:hypothetical protein
VYQSDQGVKAEAAATAITVERALDLLDDLDRQSAEMRARLRAGEVDGATAVAAVAQIGLAAQALDKSGLAIAAGRLRSEHLNLWPEGVKGRRR